MQRFFMPKDDFTGDYVVSRDKGLIGQLKKVLRAKEGDKFWLFDGSGEEFLGQLIELSVGQAKFLLIDKRQSDCEPDSQVVLYQSLVKADKLEWILQKATELGVAAIVPVVSARSIVRQITPAKMKRYQEILKEATEQCGGAIIPELSLPVSFADAIKHAAKQPGIKLIAWEKESEAELVGGKEVCVFIGPEGGFTEEEIIMAKDGGVSPVSLGKRILRAETAAIATLAKLL